MAENVEIKSENEFTSDVLSSNFDASTEEFASATEKPLNEDEMRYCKHCDYQAPDWPMFAIHVLKPSHVKKVAEAMKVRVAIDPILMSITCDICNITCSGHIPWNAHLMGAKHRKAMQDSQGAGGPIKTSISESIHNRKPYDHSPGNRQQPKNVQPADESDFNSYPYPLIGLEYVTETESRSLIQWYHCSVCDVNFDNNLKFAHLVGQKHRIAVLKIKRPDSIVGLDSNNMKRSEITPILLGLARNLEQEEGRQQVKKMFRKNQAQGRGAKRGKGGNRGTTRGSTRGGRGNRGMSHTRGRGYNVGSYSNQPSQGGISSYNKPFSSLPYNSSNVGPDYGVNYQQSHGTEQSYHAGSSSYHSGGGQPYSSQPHSSQPHHGGQVYPNTNTNRPPKTLDTRKENLKSEITASLAAALGDLTKLVHDEEGASVALNVSNALTESLLKYRMSGLQ